jgi:hypothetical protein
MRIILGIIMTFTFGLAQATGSPPPFGDSSAVATATGGSVVTTTGPVNVGGQSVDTTAIGAPGLTSSANACQGSVSILAVGFSYDVVWCRTLEKARAMYQFGGAGTTAIKAQLCRDEEIREAYRVAGQPCP